MTVAAPAAGDAAPLPIHPSFWSAVGLRARDADVIVQKNFFHYRMFYLTTSFHHIPVVTSGASSLSRARDRFTAAHGDERAPGTRGRASERRAIS